MPERGDVYLDNAATTRPLDAVVDAMAELQRAGWGNPSSPHAFGSDPHRRLEDAREFLRGSLCAARLVFTSGGTEADLLGIVGAVQHRPPGRVLVGAADHPATRALGAVLKRTNHRLVEVEVDRDGTIDPEALFDVMGSDVRAVAILHGHNELGTLAQLDEIVDVVRKTNADAHIHVDLVQSYGKIPFDLDLAGVDSAAISGHKLHGPRGIGCLALSSTADLTPIQVGGGQEDGLRGGTENVAGAVGLALAAEHALTHLEENARRMAAFGEQMFAAVQAESPDAERLGPADARLPHILSMRIPGVVGQTLQQDLDRRGVAISTGAACHGDRPVDNHVLAAIGMRRRRAREVVRISFSSQTTHDEVERATEHVLDVVHRLREIAPSRT